MSGRLYQFPIQHIAPALDRQAIRVRVERDYAQGERERLEDTADHLIRLAEEIRAGMHGEIILNAASRLVTLRSLLRPIKKERTE